MTRFIRLAALVGMALVMFTWGVLVAWKQVFPYQLISSLYGLSSTELPRSAQARMDLFGEFQVQPELIMLGDSITRAGEWAEFFGFLHVINRGIDADTTDRVMARLSEVTAKRAEVVVVMLGINDIFQDVPLADIQVRYRTIVEELRRSGADVVVMATLYCSTQACLESHNAKVTALNRDLREFADTEQLVFVDLNPILAPESTLLPEYTYDGIHLTAPAYRVWVNALQGLVAQ